MSALILPDSSPSLCGFDPRAVPYQMDVVRTVRGFDYSELTLELLLSGAYGSAKSILLAHLLVTHCMLFPRARACIARRALPDLRRTLFAEIIEHISGDLIEGKDFWYKETTCDIWFRNGSEMIPATWADRRYKKFRSLKLSAIGIEELTENDEQDMEAYKQLRARLRRLPHMRGRENWAIANTNPDSPAHWAYKYWIAGSLKLPDMNCYSNPEHPNRKVFYSRTIDNPFLDRGYYEGLARDLPAKERRRFLDGEWIEIATEVVYYEYEQERNYRDRVYKPDLAHPIRISWDFNIGQGKPLSVALFQLIDDRMHIFDQVVVEGMRTADSLDELAARGILDIEGARFVIHGDATGKAKSTNSLKSNYEIIKEFFSNYTSPEGRSIQWEMYVPMSNPPIRERHNKVNAYCFNGMGEVRLFVYKGAPMADEGLRLTQLKKGADYIEDDSKPYQHITTAIGYGLVSALKQVAQKPQGSRVL